MTPATEKALRAISYHDLFDFPLTAEELRPAAGLATADETLSALAEAGRLGLVSTANGLYALRGREALFDVRRRRYLIAEDKYKRALRFFRFARYVPFLRAVFICNTLGRSNAREESDIDLFLVVRPRRLWIARLLLAGLAAALGLRPTPTDGRDKLCFSFFVSEDALNLRPLAIQNDVYLARWLEDLCPIYDEDGYAAKVSAANRWAGSVRAASASHRRSLPKAGALKRALERAVDVFGDAVERSAKRLQMRLLPEELKRLSGLGTGVVLTDAVLKFHDGDRRAEIRDRHLAAIGRFSAEKIPA
jgi:hypothetical protein